MKTLVPESPIEAFLEALLVPPDEPINFNDNISILERTETWFFEDLNPHNLDSKISFESVAHKYHYDGVLMEQSVTEFYSSFFEKFDADAISSGMIAGRNWPRSGYIHEGGKPYTTVSPELEEISKLHLFYDKVINAKGIQPYRTEWRIAAPDLSLAGSIDFVGKFPDGTFALIDWKWAKNLDKELYSIYGKRARSLIGHIHDCKCSKYKLQLNKYILEKYYDIRISYMSVVSFHPTNIEDYINIEVPVWDDEVEAMMQTRVKTEDHLSECLSKLTV